MDSSKAAGGEQQERSRVLVRTLACVLQKLVDVNRKVSATYWLFGVWVIAGGV